jgi:hypothetical protein
MIKIFALIIITHSFAVRICNELWGCANMVLEIIGENIRLISLDTL